MRIKVLDPVQYIRAQNARWRQEQLEAQEKRPTYTPSPSLGETERRQNTLLF